MKERFDEKLIKKCRWISRRHKWAVKPVTWYMLAVLSVYHTGRWIGRNGKRLSCAGLLLLFLTVGSSFAVVREAESPLQEKNPEENGIQLTEEQEIDSGEVASIGADTIEKTDDVALLDEEDLTLYTLDEILSNSTVPEDYEQIRKEEAEDKTGLPSTYEEAQADWRLLLVNKQHSIPDDYEFPLGTISGSMQCDARVLEQLLLMMQAAKDDGVDLVICSPYRDFNRQTYLFNRKITRYMNAGMSYMDAYKEASIAVTSPNASEHRLGLAFDFYSSSYRNLNEGFADTETGKWLKEHSYEYGFVLRYPKGKEYITGIEFEPWHFRYVGVDAATYMTTHELTLEEFWEEY